MTDLEQTLGSPDARPGLRMEGTTLVVPRRSVALPCACVLCGGAPDGDPVFVAFRYHPASTYALLLLGVVTYFVFAPLATKVHPLYFYLCGTHRRRRAIARRVALASLPLTVLVVGVAFVALPPPAVTVFAALSLTVFIAGSGFLSRIDQVIRCTRIDDREARIEGASPRLLDAPPSPLDSSSRLVRIFE